MSRDDVFNLVRDHLADELELDADRIAEETRFKEDLDADSLDLYTLVQELEDTYGVRMSDEQAAKVQTAGQAVDFVLDHLPSTSSIGGPDVPRPAQTASPDDSRSNPV